MIYNKNKIRYGLKNPLSKAPNVPYSNHSR